MIVCICHRVSDRDIQRHVAQGCDSFEALQDDLRVATSCGACLDCACETFAHACAPSAGHGAHLGHGGHGGRRVIRMELAAA